jgi:hypothetical protein
MKSRNSPGQPGLGVLAGLIRAFLQENICLNTPSWSHKNQAIQLNIPVTVVGKRLASGDDK